MDRKLGIFIAIGVAIVAIAVVLIVYGNKGNHLELKGEIIKVRTGAIDEHSSAAVIDFRVENISDVPFVVREVKVTADPASGETAEGMNISKADFKQLLEFNKFLGKQFNEGMSMRDKVLPHQTVDRMIAVRFEISQQDLDRSKQIKLWIQDMDGTEFETTKKMAQ